jgi:very-short-patch-repair endonuclease
MKQLRLTSYARALRQGQTDAEHQLWMILRNRQIAGLKFRRQQVIGEYIVDFICFDAKLIIEVDGGQHNEKKNANRDEQRTQWLESRGYIVLRYWNNDVLENLEGVTAKIYEQFGKGGTLI